MAPSETRILVTGAAGVLGSRLVPILAEEYHTVAVFHNEKPEVDSSSGIKLRQCNLTDSDATARLMDETDPDIIVNCAAMTDVDGCEEHPELADEINHGTVENLLAAHRGGDKHFVQISTDYVFDGLSGLCPEDHEPNPINEYGKTKLAGESAVRRWDANSLIVRTSALYDCHLDQRANLFASTYSRLRNGGTVKAASDLWCNPIWAVNLAHALREAIDRRLTGVLNIAGPEYVTRFAFSQMIAERFGFATDLVQPISLSDLDRKATRPLKAGVAITIATELLQTKLLSPSEAFSAPEFSID